MSISRGLYEIQDVTAIRKQDVICVCSRGTLQHTLGRGGLEEQPSAKQFLKSVDLDNPSCTPKRHMLRQTFQFKSE